MGGGSEGEVTGRENKGGEEKGREEEGEGALGEEKTAHYMYQTLSCTCTS